MKKLLTILAVALTLSLLCVSALAITTGQVGGTAYENAKQAILASADPIPSISIPMEDVWGYPIGNQTFVLVTSAGGLKCLESKDLRYEWVDTADLAGAGADMTFWFVVDYTRPHYTPGAVISVVKAATCTEPGIVTKYCANCGKVVEVPTAPLGHNYVWSIYKAPTCQKAGEYAYVCTRCGEVNPLTETQVIAKVDHSDYYNTRIYTKVPNCKDGEGVYYLGCKYCKQSKEQILNDPTYKTIYYKDDYADYYWYMTNYEKVEIDPEGHDWDGWVNGAPATCAAAGQKDHWCKICGEKRSIDDWKNQPALKANYSLKSQKRYTVAEILAKGLPEDKVCEIVELTFSCSNCGGRYANHPTIKVVVEKGKAPVFLDPTLVVENIQATLDSDDESWHLTYTTWVADSTDALSALGVDVYWDHYLVNAHEYEEVLSYYKGHIAAANPCTDNEYDEFYCVHDPDGSKGHPTKKVVTKKAEGHTWGEWVEDHKVHEGDNEYGVWVKTCKKCGATENMISKTPPSELCKGNHKWVVVPEKTTAATCTTDGVTFERCSVCNEERTTAAKATGHKFGEWKTTKAATCKEEGEAIRICSVCKVSETKTLAKGDHTYDAGKVTKEPTGTSTGVKTFTCTVCGATKTEEIAKLPVTAEYDVKKIDYTNPVATGVAELKAGTDPLAKAYARVTFFLANGDCMVQIVEVDKDGKFTAGAIGNFVHISVVIVDVDDAYGADEAIEHAFGNGGKKL